MTIYSSFFYVSALLSIATAVEPIVVKVAFNKSTGDFQISLQGQECLRNGAVGVRTRASGGKATAKTATYWRRLTLLLWVVKTPLESSTPLRKCIIKYRDNFFYQSAPPLFSEGLLGRPTPTATLQRISRLKQVSVCTDWSPLCRSPWCTSVGWPMRLSQTPLLKQSPLSLRLWWRRED